MTRAEALAEARRRWGPSHDAILRHKEYVVGWWVTVGAACRFNVAGTGTSFAGAFADADRREATK